MLIGCEFDVNNNQVDMSHILNWKSKLEANSPKGHLKFYSVCLNKMKQPKTNQFGTAWKLMTANAM